MFLLEDQAAAFKPDPSFCFSPLPLPQQVPIYRPHYLLQSCPYLANDTRKNKFRGHCLPYRLRGRRPCPSWAGRGRRGAPCAPRRPLTRRHPGRRGRSRGQQRRRPARRSLARRHRRRADRSRRRAEPRRRT